MSDIYHIVGVDKWEYDIFEFFNFFFNFLLTPHKLPPNGLIFILDLLKMIINLPDLLLLLINNRLLWQHFLLKGINRIAQLLILEFEYLRGLWLTADFKQVVRNSFFEVGVEELLNWGSRHSIRYIFII